MRGRVCPALAYQLAEAYCKRLTAYLHLRIYRLLKHRMQPRKIIERHRRIQMVLQMIIHLLRSKEKCEHRMDQIRSGFLVRILWIRHAAVFNRPTNAKKYLRECTVRHEPVQYEY